MSYKRVYGIVMFSCFALVDLIFSVALSYSLGIKGFLLPTLLVLTAYLVVDGSFELLLYVLDWRDKQQVRSRRRF